MIKKENKLNIWSHFNCEWIESKKKERVNRGEKQQKKLNPFNWINLKKKKHKEIINKKRMSKKWKEKHWEKKRIVFCFLDAKGKDKKD